MTYYCIKCKKVWSDSCIDYPTGTLCDKCFTTIIRQKQISKGYHDCYKRAVNICSKKDCFYHKLCNKNI